MQYAAEAVEDSLDVGTVITAWLSPQALGQLEPMLRRLLAGKQSFVKQRDGRYRPKGCELGLARSFDLADLHEPSLRRA